MSTDNWDEIRTAFHVARLGTVSGAAEVLGVHHATVIRHIDALEQRLGTKLFQRHARGYSATDAGLDLMQVAGVTDDQFSQLTGRLRGQVDAIEGELTVTCPNNMETLLIDPIADLQRDFPGLRINLLSDERVYRLEYGEAHVALRAGPKPQEPDNVVQHAACFNVCLAASDAYLAKNGMPKDEADFASHWFVNAPRNAKPPFAVWLNDRVSADRVVVRARGLEASEHCVRNGLGIGFVRFLEDGMTAVIARKPEWEVNLWLVTHVDLHRTLKVQTTLKYLKEHLAKVNAG